APGNGARTAPRKARSRRTDRERVDDLAQDARVGADLVEPRPSTVRGLVCEAPGAFDAVRRDVAVAVEDVVDDLKEKPELVAERAPGTVLGLRDVSRPERRRHRAVEEAARLQAVHLLEIGARHHRVEVLS